MKGMHRDDQNSPRREKERERDATIRLFRSDCRVLSDCVRRRNAPWNSPIIANNGEEKNIKRDIRKAEKEKTTEYSNESDMAVPWRDVHIHIYMYVYVFFVASTRLHIHITRARVAANDTNLYLRICSFARISHISKSGP